MFTGITPVVLAGAAVASTLGGGALALRFRDRLHYLLGFTAGVLLGVVAFDLLPEIFSLARENAFDASAAMVALVVGFLLFHGLEKFVLVHPAQENHYSHHHHPHVGLASAAVLAAHSCMDGVAIGIGWQVSPMVGLTVALAVIAHDFSDGLNTVSLMLRHRNSTRRAIAMLVVDALAPLLGVLLTQAFTIPPFQLMVYLGFFAGFLLYIGVSDILPEAHSRAGPGIAARLIALTCCGAAFVWLVVRQSA
ncbi:MAG: ZIP family metal transporter [Burkholderiales bacterium]|nr:ZIP family metal transporter [Burkholderiales bacterium]